MAIQVEVVGHTEPLHLPHPLPPPPQKQLMSQYLEEKFKEGVSAMVGVLAEVAAEISGAYGALRLHLPQSADRVAEYMGPRWERRGRGAHNRGG